MENPTRTHIRSVRFGGSLTDENKVIVCTPCNNDKGYLTLKDLLRKLRRGGETCGQKHENLWPGGPPTATCTRTWGYTQA